MSESAVIVAVPAAEPAVAALRSRLDPSAPWGVPAHVTVLYPFVHPDAIDDEVLSRLARVLRTVPAFELTLARVDWFGDDVVWLAPEPAQPFHDLTTGVSREFPDHPPYGGTIDDPVPHLTVGDGAPLGDLQAAAEAVTRFLPIRSAVTGAEVICGSRETSSWQTRARLPLGL